MAVAKRQGREKPLKMEQRKVWGPEWVSQVKQKTLLASPIYIGQAQGEEKKHIKRGGKIGLQASLFSSHLLGWHACKPRGCIFLSVQFSRSIVSDSLQPHEPHSTPGLPVHHQLPEFTQTMSIKLVMPSNHLILCHPLLLLPSTFPLLSK